MAYSYTEYTAASGNDTNTAYTTPNYLTDRGATDITVTVDGTIKGTATYNLSGTSITFTTGNLPAVGAKIKITRSSSQSSRLNDYSDASLLTADTLDADANQLFFIAQEALDQSASTDFGAQTFYTSGTSAPSLATAGDLFFNTTTGLLQIYTGSAWESINNRGTKQTFAISTSTTIFTPSTPVDDNTLVFLNGVLLVKGSGSAGDYTTSSTQVTLNTAVSSGVVEVVTFPNSTNGTFTSGINVTGNVGADGFKLYRDDGVTESLDIFTDSSNDTFITENNTDSDGSLKILGTALQLRSDDNTLRSRDGNTLFFKAINSGNVNLYHGDGTSRIQTSATGIDVTGTVTTDGINTSNHVAIDNNKRIQFKDTGGNTATEIYTDTSNNTFIAEGNSSGSLTIKGESFYIRNANNQALVTSGGQSVQLAHCPDASTSNQRLETTPSGVTVTGTVTANGLTVDLGTSNTLSAIQSSTGFAQLSVKSTATGGSTDYGIIEVSGTDGAYIDIAKPDGTGYDLRIQHVDENNSIILADTSNLVMQVQDTSRAVILKHGANSPKLTTTTTGIDVTGTVTADGVVLADNKVAGFGTSEDRGNNWNGVALGNHFDLEIFHQGSASYIKDYGTGNLAIEAADLALRDNSNNRRVYCTDGASGAVQLYYGDSSSGSKLDTTATGINVTGTVTASGGYKSSDGTAGFTGSASASATLTIKNGLIVAVS